MSATVGSSNDLKRPRDVSQDTTPLPAPKRICVEDAVQYIEQVKETFVGPKENMYLEFLRLMTLFREGSPTFPRHSLDAMAVCDRIKTLFKGYDHLIQGFNMFLPPEYQMQPDQITDSDSQNTSSKSIKQPDPTEGSSFQQALTFIQNIKQRFPSDSKVYEDFLETLHLYKQRVLDLDGVYTLARGLIGEHDDLWAQFMQYLPPVAKKNRERLTATKKNKKGGSTPDETDENAEESPRKKSRQSRKQKHIWRYGATHDGPSYEMVPDGAPKVHYSGRGPLENQVLNEEFICVGSKRTRRDRYITSSEQLTSQFRYLKQVEEAMTELESILGAAKHLVSFLEGIKKKLDAKEEEVKIAKADLTQVHRGVLRHVYASKKNKIVKALRANPASAVPVVLKRFHSLIEVWEGQKTSSMRNVRAAHEVATWEAFRRNLATFKVSETKALTEKAILQDTLDRFKFHAPYCTNLSNRSIHKDIFKLIITQTQLPKNLVKEFWSEVIVPFFSLEPNAVTASSAVQKEDVMSDVEPERATSTFTQLHESPDADNNLPARSKKSQPTIFYTNTSLMLFFRYYMLMFDRLALARKAANAKREVDVRREKENIVYTTSDVQPGGNRAQSTDGQPILYPFQTTEIVDDYYARFMELTQSILAENIEQQTYEEELMKYVGFESYILFTFVHLFERLEAKLYDAIHVANCKNLISAFNYELNRTHSFQSHDDLYFRNVNRAVTFNEDLYEAKYHPQSHFFILRKIDNVSRHDPLQRLATQGRKYLTEIVDSSQNTEKTLDEKNKTHKVFLRRNKIRAKKFFKLRNQTVTDRTSSYNGMEFYLCMVTMRLRQKEGSSDVFVRFRS